MARKPGATTEQLRDDIDQGRTGDKVRFPDPAVAPLGTDEEAAGTPIDPQVIAQTREAEARMARPTGAQRSAEGRRAKAQGASGALRKTRSDADTRGKRAAKACKCRVISTRAPNE